MLVSAEHYVRPLGSFEAALFHANGILVRLDRHEAERARPVRRRVPAFASLLAGESDFGPNHNVSGWIGHSALDATGNGHLGKKLSAGEQREQHARTWDTADEFRHGITPTHGCRPAAATLLPAIMFQVESKVKVKV